MKTEFELEYTFAVKPSTIYRAWLSSDEHGRMTGGEAQCTDVESEAFSAWDGYITGVNVKLVQYREIVQKWRTSEFAVDDEDSLVTIKLEETDRGCRLKLKHEKIPNGQPDYEQGWYDHYFKPMAVYFADR